MGENQMNQNAVHTAFLKNIKIPSSAFLVANYKGIVTGEFYVP